MKKRRKNHSDEFKARVGLEAVQGLKTIQQIAKEHGVHPTQVSQWKKHLLARLPEIFASSPSATQKDWENERDKLHAKIGQLSMELDWLKKKSTPLGISISNVR